MLTGPLLITTFRQGKAYPCKLKTTEDQLETAAALIDLFSQSIGTKRSELEEELKAFELDSRRPKIVQGLGKILFDRSEFSSSSESDPKELRSDVFNASANYWQNEANPETSFDSHKLEILKNLKIDNELAIHDSEVWLFGDIAINQKMVAFDSCSAEDLIHRFNLEQVQGLLLNTVSFTLRLKRSSDAAFRQVMQMMKFFRLMYSIVEMNKNEIVFEIDGPTSVLENSRSYGLELGHFFPALLLLKTGWEIQAIVKVSGRPRDFLLELSSTGNIYKSSYKQRGVWAHQKVEDLVERINEKYSKNYQASLIKDIIPLADNRFLLPDFSLLDKDNNEEWKLEWIRYFSAQKLEQLKVIANKLPENYLIAFKGKRINLGKIPDELEKHLIIFQSELTAPSIKRKIQELRKGL